MRKRVLFVLLLAAICVVKARAADEDGFKPIFNGKDLAGWEGNAKLWSVQDGAIVGETTKENPAKGNTFLIWRGGEVKDFELRCSFKLEGNNNSGVQYRSKDLGNFVMGGYQCDINSGPEHMCKLYEERGPRGRIAMGGQKVVVNGMKPPAEGKKGAEADKKVEPLPEAEKLKGLEKKGDWNECVIIAKGNHLIQKLNGVVAIDVTDNDEKNRAMSGLVGLQIHAGSPMKISFKDIRLKEEK
ncbi:MAG TPA: DUF1080 domain-containing protein [Planctomycetota bacterium]